MENKNLPENSHENMNQAEGDVRDDAVFDEDIYLSDDTADDVPDDELDIAELLSKYLPDFKSEDKVSQAGELDPSDIVADFENESDESAEEEIVSDDTAFEADTEEESLDEYAPSDDEYYGIEEYASEDDEYIEESVDSDEAVCDTAEEEADRTITPVPELGADELEIPADANLDATDINLMVAFGLDDELEKTMGAEVAAKIAEEIDAEAKEHEDEVRRSVENEYLDPSQTATVAATMKRRSMHLKIKIFFAAVISLALLAYENISLFGIQFGGAFDPAVYPVVYIMMSLQIMLICAAVGYDQLLGGCADLFCGRINPSSIAFLGNIAAVAYSVILAESTVIPNEPVMFNACAAFMTLFALIYDYTVTKRNILSFNIISSKRPKYAVRLMTAAEAGLPENLFDDAESSEGGVLRIEKTKFVDDFFARTTSKAKSGRGFSTAYIIISLAVSLIIGLIAGMAGNGVTGVNAAFITFFATLPISLFVTMGYPFYKGVSNAFDLDATVLGETSAEEYSEAGAFCFDDVDAFPSYGVKVQNIKIYNNHRIDRVLYYAASAFKAAGGPLSDVFEVATMEIGISEDVVVQAAAEGYLGAMVDGKNIVFVSSKSLREYGIDLPDSVTGEDEYLSGDLCPMYMLREGKLMAKLLINYMLDSDFEFLLKDLSDEGMCACIKTFDPNIDDELVKLKLGGGSYPFRVLRYNNTDEINRISERVSSGIISRGSTKPLLDIVGSCSKMLGMRRAGFAVGVVSAIIAALISGILVASGGFASLCSAAIVAYQLLWILPVVFITKIFLR